MKRFAKLAATILIPAGLVGGYLATGFYLIPVWLQHELPALIFKKTGLHASLAEAEFNPLTLKLQLHQFALQQNETTPLFHFEDLDVQVNLHESLMSKNVIIDNITLNQPFLQLVKQKEGALNIDALFKSDSPPTDKNNVVFPLTIKNITLAQGHLVWQDGLIHEEMTQIDFALTHFNTQDSTPAPFNLNAVWQNGGEVNLSGEFNFAQSVSTGKLTLTHLPLSHLLTFFSPQIKSSGNGELSANYHITFAEKTPLIIIEAGTISFDDLDFQDKNERQITLQKIALDNVNYDSSQQTMQFKTFALNALRLNEGQAKLDIPQIIVTDFSFNFQNQTLQTANIALHDAELFDTTLNTLLFKLPQLEFKKLAFDLKKKTLAINAIQAKNADFKAWLNPNGELNYQTLLPEDEKQVAAESQAGNASSDAFWGIKVDNVEFTNFGATFEDKTLSKPLSISVKPLTLKLSQLSNATGAKLPFELNSGINNSGSLYLKGHAGLSPFAAQSDIEVNAINLEKFQSYIDKFAHLDLIKGVFSLDGKMDVVRGEQGELDVKFKGNTGIARLITRDQIQNKDLVKWENLTLKNVEADVLAQRYSASALLLEKPYARVVIAKDKTLNFANILINAPPEKDTKKHSVQQAISPNFHFKLDHVEISNGSSSFADFSMILPFAAEIKGLEGGATGISSNHEATINVTLKGNAYDLAPVDIKGKIQPFVGDYRAALNFKGMPLPLVSAYMAEFSGYKVEKGKMSLGMNYDVTAGELTATNNLLIEQFELGEKIDNPHAVDVPFDLAIALLKDVNGIINLDVPITGSLNDPHFDLSSIVGDALLNMVTKVVTSPFHAIAELLGTEDDLSVVQFAAGQSELTEWQRQKLEGLSKILRERSILKLEIKGVAFTAQDWNVLREEALTDRLKTLKSEEINRSGARKIRPEYVELDEIDTQKLLAQEFKAKFPQLVKKSFLGGFELVKPEMGEFYSVAKKTLAEALPVEQKRLNKLAAARARTIAKYIVQQGGVPNERVFILDTVIDPPRENDEINALLFLKAN